MQKYIIAIICTFGIYTLKAQDNSAFHIKDTISQEHVNKLFLRFNSSAFFKNNEYFSNFADGITFGGMYVQPILLYYPSPTTKVHVGYHLLKYGGNEGFYQCIPLIGIQQKLHKNVDVIIGNIQGAFAHSLEEPLYRFDRGFGFYNDNVEYGVQFLINSHYLTADAWVNWEKFIFDGAPFREQVSGGATAQVKVLEKKSIILSLPLQLFLYHEGGQVSSASTPVFTVLNASLGLDITYKPNNNNKLKHVSFSSLYMPYGREDLQDNEEYIKRYPFETGWGTYQKLTFTFKHVETMLGYWNSNQFISSKGEYLFLSNSSYSDFTSARRELITAKVTLSKKFSKGVRGMIRSEAYYDPIFEQFDFNFAFYLTFNKDFFIKKFD